MKFKTLGMIILACKETVDNFMIAVLNFTIFFKCKSLITMVFI